MLHYETITCIFKSISAKVDDNTLLLVESTLAK